MKITIIVLVSLVLVWIVGTWFLIRNIEEPKYTLISKENGYEIRNYESYIIAETTVSGSYRDSLGKGFQNIADYIFGNNTSSQKIAMTAPVIESESQDLSEKIAMTVPVISEGDDKERRISFVMPSKYTLETLPQPNTDVVTLKEVPARKVAVLRYSWYASEARVEKKKQELTQKLLKDEVEIIGTFSSAQYNPPLSIPFLRRNEVLVDIK